MGGTAEDKGEVIGGLIAGSRIDWKRETLNKGRSCLVRAKEA